jgi:hypothetical protein
MISFPKGRSCFPLVTALVVYRGQHRPARGERQVGNKTLLVARRVHGLAGPEIPNADLVVIAGWRPGKSGRGLAVAGERDRPNTLLQREPAKKLAGGSLPKKESLWHLRDRAVGDEMRSRGVEAARPTLKLTDGLACVGVPENRDILVGLLQNSQQLPLGEEGQGGDKAFDSRERDSPQFFARHRVPDDKVFVLEVPAQAGERLAVGRNPQQTEGLARAEARGPQARDGAGRQRIPITVCTDRLPLRRWLVGLPGGWLAGQE